MAYYVICDDDSRHESLTKEQILAAIAQAIETGNIGDCDTGFITKVKETNGGGCITFWVGTQAQYNALQGKTEKNCLYIITDDTFKEDFENAVKEIENRIQAAAEKVEPVTYKATITQSAGTGGGENLTEFEVQNAVFKHSKAAGAVFVKIRAIFNGSMAAGETMQMAVTGAPAFTEALIPDPLQQNWTATATGTPMPDVKLQAYFQAGKMYIRADKAFTVSKTVVVIFTGWYFV